MLRTDYCGLLTEKDIGREFLASGWVLGKRDMGGVIFIDLADHTGILQIVVNPQNASEASFELAETVRIQSVISAQGIIRLRDEETINPKIKTGTIELQVKEAEILSQARQLPFNPEESHLIREDLRLKYRFLDLRAERIQKNLRFRHKVASIIRNFMNEENFIEVETPLLTKSTPEGARDYLVPSRQHPGSFYALPQSPQIFKQLLMAGGIDKYYQIARCFRDEDLRADRQPEFTQLDLEMAFAEQEDVLALLERMFKYVMLEAMELDIKEAFPRLSWQEAMDLYGTDKPDLRFGLPIVDLTAEASQSDFSIFQKVIKEEGKVKAIVVPGQAGFSRSLIDELTEFAIEQGAAGMAWIVWRPDGEIYSILTKYFSQEAMDDLLASAGAKPGDFILFSADKENITRKVLAAMRLKLADLLDLRDDSYRFLLVTDFPMFAYSETEKRYLSQHHPFTMPKPEDIPYLKTNPEKVSSLAYDLVLNGVELGSGSIRIHDSLLQKQIFTTLGLSEEEIEHRFGFVLNAFSYGTPPHGGFAFGLDRLIMILLGEESLREIIAFPKSKDASCPLTGAPDRVASEQLEILGICLTEEVQAAALDSKGRKTDKKEKMMIEFDPAGIASIARLNFDQEDLAEMENSLHNILDWAAEFDREDLSELQPLDTVVAGKNIYQTEEAIKTKPEEILANAPASRENCFFVPEVIALEEE